MKFHLTIDLDNAAFDGDREAHSSEQPVRELARQLAEVARKVVLASDNKGRVRDANGNTVGHWWMS